MNENILWAFPLGMWLGIFTISLSYLMGFTIAQIILRSKQRGTKK